VGRPKPEGRKKPEIRDPKAESEVLSGKGNSDGGEADSSEIEAISTFDFRGRTRSPKAKARKKKSSGLADIASVESLNLFLATFSLAFRVRPSDLGLLSVFGLRPSAFARVLGCWLYFRRNITHCSAT
jgi:hypothetical protein